MAQQFEPGFSLEHIPQPEGSFEAAPQPAAIEAAPEMTAVPAPAPVQIPAFAPPVAESDPDQLQKEVEGLLSENIADIYRTLPDNRKQAFKQQGEQVAQQLTSMIRSGLFQIKKVLKLIRDWLGLIPGVNEFFLEQEAKIKTDKIKVVFDREHARLV